MIMIIQFNNIRFSTNFFRQIFHLLDNSDDCNNKVIKIRFTSDDDYLHEKH